MSTKTLAAALVLFVGHPLCSVAGAAAGSLVATPSTLSFAYQVGSVAPAKQTLTISSTNGTQAPFAVTASGGNWLLAGVDGGTSPEPFNVDVLPIGLDPNTYSGTLTISSPGLQSIVVAVTLTVTAQVPPQLAVGPLSLNVSAVQGGAPSSGQILVSNTGGGILSFTASGTSLSGDDWLSVSPLSGTVDNSASGDGAPVSLTVTCDPTSLPAGTYQGSVTINGGGSSVTVPVTLSVTNPLPVILVSQTGLSFTAVAQGGVPLPQQLGILNVGNGSLNWNASVSTVSGGSWLLISSSIGTVQRPYLDVSLAGVSIDPTMLPGLAAGVYYGQIRIAGAAVNSPQLVTVTLTVLPAGSDPGPEVVPASLIFTGFAGVSPNPQGVMIGIRKSVGDQYLSASIGGGYTYSPSASAVQPNVPVNMVVTPNFSAVNPGEIDRGTITLQFSDGTPRNISLLTVVAPLAGSDSRFGPRASSSCNTLNVQWQIPSPPSFDKVLNGAAQGLVQGSGQTLEVQVVDNCGNPLAPSDSGSAAVQATFSNQDASLNLVHIGNGVWTGTWKPVNPSSSATVVVTAFNSVGTELRSGQSSALFGSVTVASAQGNAGTPDAAPTVTTGGVQNAASRVIGVPVAPGSLITLKGSSLADADSYAPTPLPMLWNGAQVFLGTEALPVVYASPSEIDAQVPYDAPLNTTFQVTIQRDDGLSVPEEAVVAAAEPGIFTINNMGTGPGIIFHGAAVGTGLTQPGSCGVGAPYTCTPATAGETVVIYCTGLGAVSPPMRAGDIPPDPPVSSTVNPVDVTIGGQDAWVSYSTLAPGQPGVYQVAAIVPAGVSGDAVPVVVTAAGQSSPPATMSVQ